MHLQEWLRVTTRRLIQVISLAYECLGLVDHVEVFVLSSLAVFAYFAADDEKVSVDVEVLVLSSLAVSC